MNEYFGSFPLMEYNGQILIDITRRAGILNKIFSDRYAFYPYVVKNGMRAEQVAERYYGDQNLVWLVYLSNNIVDPYHQWPMSDEVFTSYIKSTYGSIDAAQNTIAFYRVNWYDDQTELTVSEYNALLAEEKKYWEPDFDQYNMPMKYIRKAINHKIVSSDSNGNMVTPNIATTEAKYWSPVSYYDVELEDNTNKASIRLLDSRLVPAAVEELKELVSE